MKNNHLQTLSCWGSTMVEVKVLGIAQDGGRPQPGCIQPCCSGLEPEDVRYPVSLGVIDEEGNGHLFEATRYLGEQFRIWGSPSLESVWLTHAHFGHVDGLGLFGKETMASRGIELCVSDAMFHLVEQTPQWALMLKQGVFRDRVFQSRDLIEIGEGLVVEPLYVPHRDELSDMHAFIIRGPHQSLLFLPDHDTWEETLGYYKVDSIREWFSMLNVDIVLIDGTFWSRDELGGRDQTKVPHPPVKETLDLLGERQADDPSVHFIHLNHTNPLYEEDSPAFDEVYLLGWEVAIQGQEFSL